LPHLGICNGAAGVHATIALAALSAHNWMI
jgi:hypothetical protein